jgi:2-oxoglutarate dehydrogenase E1 component
VYYDLKKARNERGLDNDVALVRIEQIAPFPYDLIVEVSKQHPNAKFVFAQEEHKNQGCWTYVEPRFRTLFPDRPIR